MLSCNPALKRVKVDSPVVSHSSNEGKETFNQCGGRSSCVPLTPPPRKELEESVTDDEHNHLTTGDVSPADTTTTSSSKSPSHEQHENAEDEKRVLQVTPPTQPSALHWRSSTRLSGPMTTAASVSSAPLPVSTNGAITTLRSLSQLAMLVSSTNTTSAKEKTPSDLRLRPGESVMLLLHFDEASLRPLVSAATSELSQMRVFTLNLAKLPSQDYEVNFGKRTSTGSVVLHANATMSGPPNTTHNGTAVKAATVAAVSSAATSVSDLALSTQTTQREAAGMCSEEDEEELVPAVHPLAVSTAVAEASASAEHERFSRPSAAGTGSALTFDDAASVSSLSGDLHHASEVISERLRQMLLVDTILNPHLSTNGSNDALSNSSRREPLLFPAMIVWRAAGAPREEYPPAPPQTYSSQPSSTPAELFCDRMSTKGGPLVVKEATSIDQVHSLTLFRPVYTLENLFRTLVRTVAPSFAAKAPGDKSRTVLYLGASWCPPCMRFVHEMPQFIRDDLPSSVVCTVKADMDLAKPIYDFFKVEIIPTFVVLDNEVLMRCNDNLQQRGIKVAEASPTGGATSQSEYLRSLQDAFSKAELARLQNSNRQLVSTFVSQHSQTLSFDEDF
jgi:thiol-disulfide isomerase/thioredoxin